MLRGDPLDRLVRQTKIDVIVESIDDCYRVLGLIHQRYPPRPGRTLVGSNFRDQISSPKFNGYRALITNVLVDCPETGGAAAKALVEFRIRTQVIEDTNLMGIVAAKYLVQAPHRDQECLVDRRRTAPICPYAPPQRSDDDHSRL